jgi:hypothetical protein
MEAPQRHLCRHRGGDGRAMGAPMIWACIALLLALALALLLDL